MRRTVRSLGALLIVGGVALVTWAGVTWTWGDPFTSLYTKREQSRLADRYEQSVEAFRGSARLVSDGAADFTTAARRYRAGLKTGDPVGRLRVRRLGVNMVVVEGTDTESLKKGPGHYDDSFLPGQGELIYVAGHRTTYSAPFARIDSLRPGDRVVFEVPYGRFEYRVTGHRIVPSTAVGVLRSRGREEIALQACHPRFLASQRYIVYARPIDR
ncbi:MAG: class E sortase [Gaiellaceae bacterium]